MNKTIELTRIAEIEKKLPHLDNHTNRLNALSELAEFYTFTNVREAQKILAEQYDLLEKKNLPEYLLHHFQNTAIVENQLYNYNLSKIDFKKAIDIAEEDGDPTQQAEVYIDYIGTLFNLRERETAMDFIDKTHRLLTAYPNNILLARLLCREAYIYWSYAEVERATDLFFQSEKMFASVEVPRLKVKDIYFLSLIYSGLGSMFEKTSDTNRSVLYYEKTVDICEKYGIKSRLSWHYMNVGKAYMELEDYDNAELFFSKCTQITDDISQSARAYAIANMGYCLSLKGLYEEALKMYNHAEQIYNMKEGDFENLSIVSRWKGLLFDAHGKNKKAETYLKKALTLATSSNIPRLQAEAALEIAAFYADMGDYANAYKYEKLNTQFTRKHFEDLNRIKIDDLELKYEAERRRQEAEMLRLQATSLQLKALRAQMNPHFMFNALNSLQNYITDEFAAKYLAKFAQLMRMSLDYSELEIIALEKEIDFLDNYLVINQKLRFDDRLQYQIEVDEELEDDIMGVPTMIVQPYIENAIEHGIKPKRGGLIKINFTLFDEDSILCVVEDNGIGREKARELQERNGYSQQHKSRGTSITEKRLELLHSDRKDHFSVKIIDLKDPLSMEALGTRVEILIPIVEIPYKNHEA